MKHFLRRNGELEFILGCGFYWRSGHWQQFRDEEWERLKERSVMRELLTDPEVALCEIEPGRWLLPGTPP